MKTKKITFCALNGGTLFTIYRHFGDFVKKSALIYDFVANLAWN